MKANLTLLLLFVQLLIQAQTKTITGVVMDKEFRVPIPYAHLWIEGTTNGITSNKNGEYTLKVDPNCQEIKASAYGYHITTQPVGDVRSSEQLTIGLEAHDLMKTETVAETETGENLIRKAFEAIAANHLVEKHALMGYYKEEEYAGDNMAYFAEAAVEAIMPDQQTEVHSRIFHVKGRKRILMDLEAEGITLTTGGAYQMVERSILTHIRPLQPQRMNKYEYRIEGFTQIDGKDVAIVSFKKKNGRYNGNIYLATDDYAVSRIEQYIRPKAKLFANWRWVEVSWIEQFKTNPEGKWYLSTSHFDGEWERRKDNKSHRYAGFYATTSLHGSDWTPTDLTSEMERGEETFDTVETFDDTFWGAYQYVDLTPEEVKQLNK